MIAPEKKSALQSANNIAAAPRWARPALAAKHASLSRSYIYDLLNEGKIKSHRIGGARLIDLQDLDKFIESQAA